MVRSSFLLLAPLLGASSPDPCSRFDERLIQLHVYDAEGGDRKAVEEGIRDLREAIAASCPEVAEAQRMIGDAADVFASQRARKDEVDEYRTLAQSSYRKLCLAKRPSVRVGVSEWRIHRTAVFVRRCRSWKPDSWRTGPRECP